jgi:hypothetical protein
LHNSFVKCIPCILNQENKGYFIWRRAAIHDKSRLRKKSELFVQQQFYPFFSLGFVCIYGILLAKNRIKAPGHASPNDFCDTWHYFHIFASL